MRARLSASRYPALALASGVVLALVACGLETNGILGPEDLSDAGVDDAGGQDGTLDLTDGSLPPDAPPPTPLLDGGACFGGDWSAVLRATPTTDCPSDYQLIELVQDWSLPAAGCTCDPGPISLATNVCQMSAVSATSKTCRWGTTKIATNGACTDAPGPAAAIGLNIAGGYRTAVRTGVLGATGGTLVRVCIPSDPQQASLCVPLPSVDPGLTSCVIRSGKGETCPTGYPNALTLSQLSDSRQCTCTYEVDCSAHFSVWNQKGCKGVKTERDVSGMTPCNQLSPVVSGPWVSLQVNASPSVLSAPIPGVTGGVATIDYTVCCP